MKKSLFMLSVLFCVGVMSLATAGCSRLELYTVNEPAWLQEKIDSIAAEKRKREQGDTATVDITKTIVGAEDFSSGWWADHSQYFPVPSGKLLHFEFVNHSSKANNWNNWVLVMATTPGASTDDDPTYSELFVLRADAYLLGSVDPGVLETDYFAEGKLADWDEFKEFMDGSDVSIEVDHSSAGYVYATITAYNPQWGFSITETYNQKVPGTADVYVNITTDASYYEMKANKDNEPRHAYQIKSKIAEVPDVQPASITVTGTPASIEVGETDFWGDGVATVKFADGTTAVADTANIVFNVPDLSTPGKKTIVYSYNLTKQGNPGNMVNGFYTLDVTNPVVGIEASATAYVIGGAKKLTLSSNSVKTVAIYGDGTTGILAPSKVDVSFTDGKVVYDCVPGVYKDALTVTYITSSGDEMTAVGDLTIAASSQGGQLTQVGYTDCTTPWWSPDGFSKDWTVSAGESQIVSMYLGSDNAANFHSPCVVLRNAAKTAEYIVVRMDNYGWDPAQTEPYVKTCDWNWETFMPNLNGSQVAITVSNGGSGLADIRYYVVLGNGEEHFQYYDSIPVDSEDLTFAIVTEGSYLIFD